VRELNAKEGIDFRVIGEGQARPLDAVIRDEVYRIGREAVVNAFQHSERIESRSRSSSAAKDSASRSVRRPRDRCAASPGRTGGTLGLAGMRERAKRIAGDSRSERADTGTEVELSVRAESLFGRMPAAALAMAVAAVSGQTRRWEVSELKWLNRTRSAFSA